ncbi:energy-coupling factor ABC transporter permease [Marinobacterium rhizophilum]|uniref:energy-coupling factor ABC transporter permease n=1 Tax=Marinobacterium rhizophilum TaxID=420402 RepID=UPI00035E3731|nr:energy-coupling factor ABC transporter permease [Marinobacterium rhizophilum]
MSITDGLLTGSAPLWFHALFALIVLLALWRLPWGILLGNRRLQHLFFGSTVALTLLWIMRAGITPGLGIHFLGMTTLTLMFGWDLAIVSAALALLGVSWIGLESWQGYGLSGLCTIVLPALTSLGILRLVEAYLPKNFFVYLFCCAFLGSALAVAAGGLAAGLLLWGLDVYPWSRIQQDYVILLPLIMFPEGLLNGILMTGMMVFYPDWIRSFNARIYIDDQ